MWSLFLAAENLPFSIALALMGMIGLLEFLGLLLGQSLGSVLDILVQETDLAPPTESSLANSSLSQLLSWLRVGEVPVLMLLVVFLLCFGLIGFFVQVLCLHTLGSYAPSSLAVFPALLFSIPGLRLGGGLMQRLMPRDESTAVSADSLLGRVATITRGTARFGLSAEAKVRDQFGYTHYVQVEPDDAAENLVQGSQVLLLSRQGSIYKVMLNPSPHLSDYDN
jgi:hypothetical protein